MNTRQFSRGRSTNRYSLLAAIAAIGLVPATLAVAQPAEPAPSGPATPDIDTSAYTFAGEINTDGALVRSGPSESDYPAIKLNKGAKLTVVGLRFEWLKIEPPEGSFCLVSQAFVDKRGDGSVGRISTPRATIRVGSAIVQSKHRVPTLLDQGEEVQIIGELDEYYMIKPPKGVYLYVDKKFVNPVRRIGEGADAPPTGPGGQSPLPPGQPTNVDPNVPTGAEGNTLQPTPDRFIVISGPAEGNTAPPTTNPSVDVTAIRTLQDRLTKLEDRYTAASQQELADQPLDELAKDYTALLADPVLPPNARKIAEYRTQSLQLRKDTLVGFLAAKQAQAEAAQRQRDLEAEQKELQDRVAAAAVKRYAAVGRLVPSSLTANGQPLFRLVDPSTSRTIIYVRTGEISLAAGVNQFVGISGQVITDDAMHLTYVQPTAFENVDPAQLNTKVFAEFVPPSLSANGVAGAEPGGE